MQRLATVTNAELYKAATGPDNPEYLPLWHVGEDQMFFAGRLDYHKPHSHAVPLLLVGLYEAFQLRLEARGWRHCKAALIPANVSYELNGSGMPMAVCYFEPAAGRKMVEMNMQQGCTGRCHSRSHAALDSFERIKIFTADTIDNQMRTGKFFAVFFNEIVFPLIEIGHKQIFVTIRVKLVNERSFTEGVFSFHDDLQFIRLWESYRCERMTGNI